MVHGASFSGGSYGVRERSQLPCHRKMVQLEIAFSKLVFKMTMTMTMIPMQQKLLHSLESTFISTYILLLKRLP